LRKAFLPQFPDGLKQTKVHPAQDTVELFLCIVPIVAGFMSPVMGLIFIAIDIDLLQFIFIKLLTEQMRDKFFSFFIILRCAYVFAKVYFFYTILVGTLIVTIFELYVTSSNMFQLKSWSSFYIKSPRGKSSPTVRNCNKISQTPSLNNLISVHTQLKILEMTANEVFYYEVPSLIVLGSTASIFANYATITIHSSIPMPYYLLMPLVSAGFVFGVSVLFPPASKMHEDSKCFLSQL